MPIQQFILLPRDGVRAEDADSGSIMRSLHFASIAHPGRVEELPTAQHPNLRIIDTVEEEGPKLVEIDVADAQMVNSQHGPVRLLAVVPYKIPEPINPPNPADLGMSGTAPYQAAPTPFIVECIENGTRRQMSGVHVVASGGGRSDSGTTDAAGRVGLTVVGNRLDRLWAYTSVAHWGAYRADLSISSGAHVVIAIDPLSPPYSDAIANYYSASNFDASVGVTVGVVDSGVGPHADLNIVGGENTVVGAGELPSQYEDWHGHGTHVAGLIGASRSSHAGVRGLAPGVRIFSYRVFGANGNTSNYSIIKAMFSANKSCCDILNLSLGGGPVDTALEAAINDARNQGMLVVVAAGNDYRDAVSYPAAYHGATAVSALGITGCFPSGSIFEYNVLRPPHSTAYVDEFIASFSNIGPEIAVTAPGVGVISTLLNGGYGVMSGTSQAAPVVTGAAACLLSRAQDPDIYNMTRNAKRSAMLEKLVQSSCIPRGFGLSYEGYGLPDPKLV